MKTINKEIQKTETYTYYQAFDGTTFDSEEECMKFEQSAVGVILQKVHSFSKQLSQVDWLDGSNDDNEYVFAVPENQEQVDALNQLMLLCRDNTKYESLFTIGKPYVVGYRWYGNSLDWSWRYSVEDIINDATLGTYAIIKK